MWGQLRCIDLHSHSACKKIEVTKKNIVNSHVTWNRRTFLSAASAAGAAAIWQQLLIAEPLPVPSPERGASFLACVGFSASDAPATQCIETYRVEGGQWVQLGSALPCEAPSALVMHPTLPVLYVVHSTGQYLGLPRGSVSAFAVVASSGALMPLSRRPLALSATYPEYAAISRDGRTLLVSASGGGSYNVFSLAADGAILPDLHALKQTGSGPHALQMTAYPHAVVFHPSGLAAYASDLGSDRINHITFAEGSPSVASRVSLIPGDGPGHIALHPSCKVLVICNQLCPALTVIPIDEKTGRLHLGFQHFALDAKVAGPLAFGLSNDYMYVAGSAGSGETFVLAFHMDLRSFQLRTKAVIQVPSISWPEHLLVHKRELLLIGTGGVASLPLDSRGGFSQRTSLIREADYIFRRRDAVSIAVLPL